jgi:hypothetical protein
MKKKKLSVFLLFLILLIAFLNIFYLSKAYLTSQENLESNINKRVYISPYIGDIDGEVSEEWFFFYRKILEFHEKNKIPVTFSFYPSSIQNDEEFNDIFLEIYKSNYVELMQKGDTGDELEQHMDTLSYEQQKEIIKHGQEQFKEKMQKLTQQNNIELPIAYNQIGARFTNETRDILTELGYKFYFDVYVGDYLNPVKSTENFDVIEYGISFTESGDAGRKNDFKTPQEIFQEIEDFDREDITILNLSGKKVIPLWAHQQDFESIIKENKLDKEKWKIYTETILALKKDSNVIFITPNEIFKRRH